MLDNLTISYLLTDAKVVCFIHSPSFLRSTETAKQQHFVEFYIHFDILASNPWEVILFDLSLSQFNKVQKAFASKSHLSPGLSSMIYCQPTNTYKMLDETPKHNTQRVPISFGTYVLLLFLKTFKIREKSALPKITLINDKL